MRLMWMMLISVGVCAQSNSDTDNRIELRLESYIASNPELQLDQSDIIDQLKYIKDHPINLNQAEREEIRTLHLLTEIQIENLMQHREKYGDIGGIEELQVIRGFDRETILMLNPFVCFVEKISFRSKDEISSKLKGEYLIRYQRVIEKGRGYANTEGNRYLGSPDHVYCRIKNEFGKKIEGGVTMEKDAGEPFFGYGQKLGFDFYSGYIQFKEVGRFKKIIIGDFKAQFGQGLTFFSAGGAGKSSGVLLVEKSPRGIMPYRSVNEFQFLRGIASEIAYKNVTITPFYSRTMIDGNLNGETDVVTSFYQSGLHRNQNEMEKKHNLISSTIGVDLRLQLKRLKLGLTGANNSISLGLNDDPEPYEIYRRRSASQTNAGVYHSYVWRNFNLFGEISHSIGQGFAIVQGITIMPHERVTLAICYRNYKRDFTPIQSAGFGEYSINQNEKGIYFGAKTSVTRKLTIGVYSDLFQSDWLRYRVSAPSSGQDYFTDLTYAYSKAIEFYLRWRKKVKAYDQILPGDQIPSPSPESKEGLRFQIRNQVTETLRWRSRLEWVWFKDVIREDRGILMFQELKWQKIGAPVSIVGRFTMFQSTSYDARIYAYEQDVPGVYAIPAFQGKGSGYFVLLRYKMNYRIDWWVRFGQIFYDDRDETGSGLDEISGDRKSNIKLQCRIKL